MLDLYFTVPYIPTLDLYLAVTYIPMLDLYLTVKNIYIEPLYYYQKLFNPKGGGAAKQKRITFTSREPCPEKYIIAIWTPYMEFSSKILNFIFS